jgi:hypothetical protein
MHGNSNIKLILYIVQNNESWLNKSVVIIRHQNTSQKKIETCAQWTWELWLQCRRLIISVFVETSGNYFCFCPENSVCVFVLSAYVASILLSLKHFKLQRSGTSHLHSLTLPLAAGVIFPPSCIIPHLVSSFAAFNCLSLSFLFLSP